MKKKRRLKTNVAISFIYTLVILCMISFSFILPTNSKFITAGPGGKEGTALKYQVGLYPLYVNTPSVKDADIGITVDENDSNIFTFSFEFKRHYEVAYDVSDTNKDNYSFIVTPGCTIEAINGSKENTNTISFDTRGEENSTVKVDLKCNYDTLKGNNTETETTVSVGIKEKFGIEGNYEQEFLYTEPAFIISDEYYSEIANITHWGPTLEIPKGTSATEREQTYQQWVEEYVAPKSGYEALVKKYLINRTDWQQYILNGTDEWNDNSYGIIRKYKLGAYTYTIADNLVGYVRTENASQINANHMYFTTKNPTEIEEAFEHYLIAYQKKKNYTDKDIADIMEYINARGGIANAILEKKFITGLNCRNGFLNLDDRLLQYARNLKNPLATQIDLDSKPIMNTYFTQFTKSLDTTISPSMDFYTELSAQLGSTASKLVYKNNTQDYTVPSSFIDYYIVWDAELEHYIILKIYSDISKDATHRYNIYEFRTLAWAMREGYEQPSIQFTNSSKNPDNLNIFIEFTAPSQAEAEKMVYDDILIPLRGYFGQELPDTDVTFEWDETEKYGSATFTVSKGYDDLLPTGGVGSAQRSKEKTESVIEVVEKTISDMNTAVEDEKKEDNKEQEILDEKTTIETDGKIEEELPVVNNEVTNMKEDNTSEDPSVEEEKEQLVEEEKDNSLPMINSIMSFFLRK